MREGRRGDGKDAFLEHCTQEKSMLKTCKLYSHYRGKKTMRERVEREKKFNK